ncbi:hypothetical protein M707_02645 [Arthrobacter sp. AK-YN10]|nr:hypothetical protein M707_02645 [Arthrobacter sp. AK-YN10]
MSARYEFKVGPLNRHSGYAHPVTVVADSYSEAESKALDLSGWGRNGKTWFIRVDEVAEVTE